MNNPFQTGRTFDAVGDGLAKELVEEILDDPSFVQFLEAIASGEREPRELPSEFQAVLEQKYLAKVEQGKDDETDFRSGVL